MQTNGKLSTGLHLLDKMHGMRRMKKDYQPSPNAFKNLQGNLVKQHDRADVALEYLEKSHWNKYPVATRGEGRRKCSNTARIPA